MLYTDMPPDVLRQAQAILNATIRPAASTPATIARTPHGRISDQAHEQLRKLRLAARPAGANTSLLVHVWETYHSKLPQRADTKAGTLDAPARHIPERRKRHVVQPTPAWTPPSAARRQKNPSPVPPGR